MIDINYSLRIGYTSVLQPMITAGVKLYYFNAPPIPANNYIVMYGFQSVDSSTNGSCDTVTTVSFAFHGFDDIVNNGLSVDIMVRDFLRLIYSSPQSVITIDGAQMVNIEMINDIEQPVQIIGGRNYKQRNITLRHNIFQRSDIS